MRRRENSHKVVKYSTINRIMSTAAGTRPYFLEDTTTSWAPSTAPTVSNSIASPSPSSSATASESNSSSTFARLLFYMVTVILGFFILRYFYHWYRQRREFQFMRDRNSQADRVLGDMQMIPNDDLDNELL